MPVTIKRRVKSPSAEELKQQAQRRPDLDFDPVTLEIPEFLRRGSKPVNEEDVSLD